MKHTIAASLGLFIILGLLFIAILAFAPLATIWSINTLFGFGIEFNYVTWFAMAWLHFILLGSIIKIPASNKK